MLKPWDQETGMLDGSQINLEIAVKHWPPSQLRKVLSCCSPALCCLTHGVNQPSTQLSVKAAFLTALLSMVLGIGETVQQGLHVLFTLWVV